MKNRLVAAGLLAGGIALTGLTGSAYAAGTTPAAKDTGKGKVTGVAKGHGLVAVACVGTAMKVKGKPEKGTFSIKEPARLSAPPKAGKGPVTITGGKVTAGKPGDDPKALPAPPAGAKTLKLKALKLEALKDGAATAKIKALPKGVHCFSVKPGTPGGPPPVPAR